MLAHALVLQAPESLASHCLCLAFSSIVEIDLNLDDTGLSVKSHFKSLFIDWKPQTFLLSKEPQTVKEFGPVSLKVLANGRKPYKLNG